MNLKNPRLAYREAAVQSASSVELVIMLYDMLIEDIRGAIDALRENNVEKRGEELKHGMLVLQHLQGSLDFERGGEAAVGLERFYTMVRGKLMEAHLKSSLELMGEQIRVLLEVRDAWRESAKQSQAGREDRPAIVPLPVEPELIAANGWSA
jgi:flagellar secretion chaperone FliS